MISSCLLYQATTVRASRFWIVSVFDDFARLLSSLLRRSHSELNGKVMLMGRFAVKRIFTYIEEGLGVYKYMRYGKVWLRKLWLMHEYCLPQVDTVPLLSA